MYKVFSFTYFLYYFLVSTQTHTYLYHQDLIKEEPEARLEHAFICYNDVLWLVQLK